jgi:transglutaminase-like putative cysteine protease
MAPGVVATVLLALVAAGSTARAGWVAGSDELGGLAMTAAVAGCLLAVAPIRARLLLALAVLPAPLAAYAAVPGSPLPAGVPGQPLPTVWWHELSPGLLARDPTARLFLLCTLFWLLGAWLAWGVLRSRQPLLAAAPVGVALATNVLNYPDGQDVYVFAFLVLTLALLLWRTYQSVLAAAVHVHLTLSEGARWDFWECGALAMAALVVLGVTLPPLSATDRTVDMANGLTQSWSRVTHGGGSGSAATSIGLSDSAKLGGPIKLTTGVVFTYTVEGTAAGPSYFRAWDLEPLDSEWGFVSGLATRVNRARGQEVDYLERYADQRRATYDVTMRRPPAAVPDVVVYPGQLVSVDRDVQVLQAGPLPAGATLARRLETVDRVTAYGAHGSYRVQVDQSTATEAELRAAGTEYPDWIGPYRQLPGAYRSPATQRQIHDLAVQVTAGATNPYDHAAAIESYLRSNYLYTLHPDPAPAGTDIESYFLFTGRRGYCVYFATAMADMLRSLGVPVRLVTGYGPGTYDDRLHRFVVQESDVHTWPEVYFPTLGWIPFEPTPDGVYFPVQRGGAAGVSCLGDSCTDTGSAAGATAPASGARTHPDRGQAEPAAGGRIGLPPPGSWMPVAAATLALLLLLAVAASRYLRPRTVAGVWRRVALLVRLAGLGARAGETPIEFGDRVARAFPESAAPIRQLARDFAAAAYAPREVAEARRPAVMAGWSSVRPLLLRWVVMRWLPARLRGAHAAPAPPRPV